MPTRLECVNSITAIRMNQDSNHLATDLLKRWRTGDASAEQELMSRVYPVIRELAAVQKRRNSGALTLQATELANEAYERLVRLDHLEWCDRDHFYAVAATVIRRIVVEHFPEARDGKSVEATCRLFPSTTWPKNSCRSLMNPSTGSVSMKHWRGSPASITIVQESSNSNSFPG